MENKDSSFDIKPTESGDQVQLLYILNRFCSEKKSLKIPKGVISSSKSKKDRLPEEKGPTKIYRILSRKLKIDQQNPPKPRGELTCARRASSPCSTSGPCLVIYIWTSVFHKNKENDFLNSQTFDDFVHV